MDLDVLNLRTSEAIFRAEALTDLHAPGAEAAHLDVSMLEERIADRTSASVLEGVMARRGAVGAAVLAGDTARAETLVARFSSELGGRDGLRAELGDILTRLTILRSEERQQAIAARYPRADAKYGAADIVRLAEAIARQAAPLPIG